jgi:hypothetical protein
MIVFKRVTVCLILIQTRINFSNMSSLDGLEYANEYTDMLFELFIVENYLWSVDDEEAVVAHESFKESHKTESFRRAYPKRFSCMVLFNSRLIDNKRLQEAKQVKLYQIYQAAKRVSWVCFIVVVFF